MNGSSCAWTPKKHLSRRTGVATNRTELSRHEGSSGGFTARQLGATYFRGSKPIDEVWTTGDITVTNACVMPVGFRVGDHRLFVIDFATTTLVGSGTTTVVCLHCADLTQRYMAVLIGIINPFVGISSVAGSWNEWWRRLCRAPLKMIWLRS